MSDPVSERAHYLAVGGVGHGDLFLIQQGRVEHLGLLRAALGRPGAGSRAARPPKPDRRAPGGIRRVLCHALTLAFALAL